MDIRRLRHPIKTGRFYFYLARLRCDYRENPGNRHLKTKIDRWNQTLCCFGRIAVWAIEHTLHRLTPVLRWRT